MNYELASFSAMNVNVFFR